MGSNDGKYRGNNNYNSQLKTEIFNLRKELGELKTEIYDIKQYFSAEKPGHTWDKVRILFKDGGPEEFTNVVVKKYTMDAVNIKGARVQIEKSSIKYIVLDV